MKYESLNNSSLQTGPLSIFLGYVRIPFTIIPVFGPASGCSGVFNGVEGMAT